MPNFIKKDLKELNTFFIYLKNFPPLTFPIYILQICLDEEPGGTDISGGTLAVRGPHIIDILQCSYINKGSRSGDRGSSDRQVSVEQEYSNLSIHHLGRLVRAQTNVSRSF